jgi:CBS domain-containing protein
MRARELMTQDFETVSGTATVREAIEMMRERQKRCLIVQPRDKYDAHGIITDRDVVYKVVATGGNPDLALVHQVMTKPLVTIDPSLEVKYIARLLAANRISRAPVVEVGKVIGIISIGDILRRGI